MDPDVYCRMARAVSGKSGTRQVLAAASSSDSGAIQVSFISSGSPSSRRAMRSEMAGLVSAKRALASPMMLRSRIRGRPARGGYAGTATAPAYKQANKAIT